MEHCIKKDAWYLFTSCATSQPGKMSDQHISQALCQNNVLKQKNDFIIVLCES